MKRYGWNGAASPPLRQSYIDAGVKPGDIVKVSSARSRYLGRALVRDPSEMSRMPGVVLEVLESNAWRRVGYVSSYSHLTLEVIGHR